MNVIYTQDDCYKQIDSKCTIRESLYQFSLIDDNWINPSSGTFFKKTPPKDLILSDAFLKHVCTNYIDLSREWIYNVHIFLLRPFTHYCIHTDAKRESSINLLLNPHSNSLSYFQNTEYYNKLHFGFLPLNYQTDCMYLFNSQVPHAVTNLDSPRFLLSITLQHDYNTMLANLKKDNYIS